MQDEIEDLLHEHRVDLVLSGHIHAYFRSCGGLYPNKCNNGGPVHITVGTAGANLSVERLIPNDYTEHFDRKSFGVGRATVYNASALHWEFVSLVANVTDEVWLKK